MAKLTIVGVDGAVSGVALESQFNPKEISIDKSVPWQLQKTPGPGDLEFTSANPKTMSFELLFDGFESGSSIEDEIGTLHQLSDIDPSLKRPPKVKVIWGPGGGAGMIPAFEGVVAWHHYAAPSDANRRLASDPLPCSAASPFIGGANRQRQ